MAKALSTLPVGTLVKDPDTKYNDATIVWKIADQNHEGYPANSTTLISDKILSLKCFDAKEPKNSDMDRARNGNNRYLYSNIRLWLNSAAGAGKWYTAQHSMDAPPTSDYVSNNKNAYDQEAGFLYGFSANMRAGLLLTTHTIKRNGMDGGGTETCTDKIFITSCTEVGITSKTTCGVKLELFSDNTSRLAYPTAECVSKSTYKDSLLNVEKGWKWWATDDQGYPCSSLLVSSSGAPVTSVCYAGEIGIRPLCNLAASILVSDEPDADGVYTISFKVDPGLYIKQSEGWKRVIL